MPPCPVYFNSPEGLTLPQIASRINALCGFRVYISPEVSAALLQSAGGSVVTSQMSGRLPAPDDNGRVPLSQMGMPAQPAVMSTSEPVLFQGTRFQGDAQEALNIAASTLGLSVRRTTGRVDFFIQDTRTFQLAILNTKVDSSASITSGAGAQLGNQSGTGGTKGDVSSNQKTNYGMNSDLYNDIRKTVEQILTPKSGRYWLSDATGTLSVTDTPDVLDRVGRYIDYQNQVLHRQVQLTLQIVRFTQTKNVDRGLDWGLVARTVSGLGASIGSTFTGAPANAGSFGLSILNSATGGAEKFSGSQLMIRALEQQGTVTMALNQTDPTANLTPVAYQLKEPLAWAEGCNPLSDDGWRKLSDCLITEKYFFHQFDLSQEACDAVLNEHQDLLVSFICQTPGAVGVFAETGEPEKVYLPVGIYRSRISWLGDHALHHFHSCVGNAERLSWRSQALSVLDSVIRLDSRRAKPSDREMLNNAVQELSKRISQIAPDGSIHFYS